MNQRLAAILVLLDQCNHDLAKSTARYKSTNDKFAQWVNRWAPKSERRSYLPKEETNAR